MFNVGIVGAVLPADLAVTLETNFDASLLNIYNDGGGFLTYLGLRPDGVLTTMDTNGKYVARPPAWKLSAEPSSLFSVRFTTIAGRNPGGVSLGVWHSLASERAFYWYDWNNSRGRVQVEIRRESSGVVLASRQFWTPGHAP